MQTTSKVTSEIVCILFHAKPQKSVCPLHLEHISITVFHPLNLHFDLYLDFIKFTVEKVVSHS